MRQLPAMTTSSRKTMVTAAVAAGVVAAASTGSLSVPASTPHRLPTPVVVRASTPTLAALATPSSFALAVKRRTGRHPHPSQRLRIPAGTEQPDCRWYCSDWRLWLKPLQQRPRCDVEPVRPHGVRATAGGPARRRPGDRRRRNDHGRGTSYIHERGLLADRDQPDPPAAAVRHPAAQSDLHDADAAQPAGLGHPVAVPSTLVAIAREHGLLIIEDAAYAFLVTRAPIPLAALAPELAIYISGLSKNVATGLRFGFVVAPTKFIAPLERVIRATTWNTPALMTAIATGWLNDGTVTRLESQKREDARRRQSVARNVLNGLELVGHPSSYFLWLPLPGQVRADQVATALMHETVSVSKAEPFATTKNPPHAIRLALGSVTLDLLAESLATVKRVIDAHTC